MNNSRPFLQAVESLAQAVKTNLEWAPAQSIAEADNSSSDENDATALMFRSHFACEQG